VVDEPHVHVSAETPALYRIAAPPQLLDDPLVQPPRLFGRRRVRKTRAASLADIAVQRELGNDKKLAAAVRDGKIHLPRSALENCRWAKLFAHPAAGFPAAGLRAARRTRPRRPG